MRRWIGLILLCLILFPQFSWAEDQPVNAVGDKIWGDTQKKWAFLEGNVRITQGSTIINTANAQIDLDKKLIYLKDGVKLVHPEATIESNTLDYDLRKKIGTFKQSVVMNRGEIKDSTGKVTKDAFKLTCEQLYFESETKNFIAIGKGTINNKDFDGKADRIEYDDKTQELLLKENAYLKKPEGEEITGDQVKINLKDRSFIVEKNVTIHMNVEDETPTPTATPKDQEKKK